MPWIAVADLDDRRLDAYRHLKRTNETARRGLFIAEGDKLVRRLLDSPLEVESVLVDERYVDAFRELVPPQVPAFVVPNDRVEQLVGFNFHRGILACGRRPGSPPLKSVLDPPAASRLIVVCPNVQDPENLGAIVRLCRAFAVDGLLLGGECADPFSRRVQRVSMGCVYRLPIVVAIDMVAALQVLREQHAVESWAAYLSSDAETFEPARRARRLALVFGSEGHGLPPEIAAACDRRVMIPMPPGVDSLNVAVTAGIMLYECTKVAS